MERHLPTLRAFADAFNRRDLGALGDALVEDAWAEVLGSPFPREQGREAILRTSLAYLLDLESNLGAEARSLDDANWVLLRQEAGAGPIDTAIRVTLMADKIGSLEYVVAPHRPAELHEVGATLGLPTVADA